jgi:hypothetical protein
MSQHYSNPERENNPHALPDIEIFELTAPEAAGLDDDLVWEYMKRREFRLANMSSRVREKMLDAIVEEQGITGGWFWQSCLPGCLPDGDPVGPFASRKEALTDAQQQE